MSTALNNVTRKTYNIKNELVKEMERLVSSRKQTEFVNDALQEFIAKQKKEKAKEDFLKMLHNLKGKRIKSSKSSVELIRELREERSNIRG